MPITPEQDKMLRYINGGLSDPWKESFTKNVRKADNLTRGQDAHLRRMYHREKSAYTIGPRSYKHDISDKEAMQSGDFF